MSKMPPQNAVELVQSSGSEGPKHTNLNNNNNRENLKLELKKVEEDEVVEPTKATIIIPPDGGFGWIVMVRIARCQCGYQVCNTLLSFVSSLLVSAVIRSSTVSCSVLECSLIQFRRIWVHRRQPSRWLGRCSVGFI